MTTLNQEMNAEVIVHYAVKAMKAGLLDNFEKMFIEKVQNLSADRIYSLNMRQFDYLLSIAEKGENL